MIGAVSLQGVGCRYGRTWAVRDVNLELSVGVVGLLGPNGAGKTSLLRMLATSLPPSEPTTPTARASAPPTAASSMGSACADRRA